MNPDLQRAVSAAIAKATDKPVEIVSHQPIGGGCINDACVMTSRCGDRFFLKTNISADSTMFEAEARGLSLIESTKTVRVPSVVALGTGRSRPPFLVLEYVQRGRFDRAASERLGRQLAQMHLADVVDDFGLDHDNFLGSARQINNFSTSWAEFWRERRLGFQLNWARDQNLLNKTEFALGQKLLDRIEELIDDMNARPSLLHGDLWSGNYLCDDRGNPVLIDPAVYYGDREAEFGMIVLFGGLDRNFYAAYEEVWPLSEGYQDRFEIYKLYHLLNHLNLFGRSYHSQCMSIIRRYAN